MRRTFFVLLGGAALSLAGPSFAQQPVAGQVKTLTGSAMLTRAGQAEPVVPGQVLYQGDRLTTGDGASLGLILRDDTSLSLGPKAEVSLDRFVFDPAADRLGLAAKLTRGTLAVVSGQIARLAPERTEFSTLSAVIGIRGTKFVVKVDDE